MSKPPVIAIIGQSNGENLRSVVCNGLSPAAHTFMRGGASWSPPTNAMIVLANDLKAETGIPIYLVMGAVQGAALLNIPNGASPCWLRKEDANQPFQKLLSLLQDTDLRALWFIGGEHEALNGDIVTKEIMLAGLIELYASICGAVGKVIGEVEFLISPTGAAATAYALGRRVLEGEYRAAQFPGIRIGPDYWDLPTDSTGIHLTPAGYIEFAKRGAAALVDLVKTFPSVIVPGIEITPIMTGNASPAGYVASSSHPDFDASTPPWKAFDKNVSGYPGGDWIVTGNCNVEPVSLMLQFPSPVIVRSYRMTARPQASVSPQAGTAWSLDGSDDGNIWTPVDTRSDEPPFGAAEARTYTVTNPAAHLRWRLRWTASPVTQYVALAELNLFG